MSKAVFSIKPYKHPVLKFVVRSKQAEKWTRKFFETEAQAKTFVGQKTVELESGGREGMEFPAWLRVMAQHSQERLDPYGKTLADAVSFYLPHLEAQAASRPLRVVVDELLTTKAKDGASSRYLKDLRNRLGIFATAHPERQIADFTGPRIDDWLRDLPHSAVTRNNYKRLLGVLFSYALSRNYVLSNPALQAKRAKVTPEKPGILTPGQARRLLEGAKPEILPAIAIGLFAGLRPEAEVWRLNWSAVDLEEKLIDVSQSKNLASDRFVTISDNLAAWLRPYEARTGPVSPTGDKYNYLLQHARAAATASAEEDGRSEEGIPAWPQDCLRHTFASMHYAQHKNAGETAQQLGHGQNLRTFIRHYKNRVNPAEAERFWAILPIED